MTTARFTVNISKILNKNLYNYDVGINSNLNKRKKVRRDKKSLTTNSRGYVNKKSTKSDSVKNSDILTDMYNKYHFPIFQFAFSKKNPNYSTWLQSVKYLQEPKRFENANVANLRAFLDKQKIKKNSQRTAETKKFNVFAVDSRQFQFSFASIKSGK